MSVSISYQLTGEGWAECDVVVDDRLASTLIASHLSDALRDLLGAVVRILEGEAEATASFEDEPGEYRWRLIRLTPDRLQVRILAFPDMRDDPDDEGKVLVDAVCRLRTFAGSVYSASQRLLEKHGLEGYFDLWGMEFPMEKFETLERLLRQRE